VIGPLPLRRGRSPADATARGPARAAPVRTLPRRPHAVYPQPSRLRDRAARLDVARGLGAAGRLLVYDLLTARRGAQRTKRPAGGAEGAALPSGLLTRWWCAGLALVWERPHGALPGAAGGILRRPRGPGQARWSRRGRCHRKAPATVAAARGVETGVGGWAPTPAPSLGAAALPPPPLPRVRAALCSPACSSTPTRGAASAPQLLAPLPSRQGRSKTGLSSAG
jgi:hypothetical protein